MAARRLSLLIVWPIVVLSGCSLVLNRPVTQTSASSHRIWSDFTTPFSVYQEDILASMAAGVLGAPTLSSVAGVAIANDDFSGGVLAPNGKIYLIPLQSGNVGTIDPETGAVGSFAHGITGAGFDWSGGVLAPNGKIYALPMGRAAAVGDAGKFLEIDPDAQTVTAVGPAVVTTGIQFGYIEGALATNGKVYLIPGEDDQVVRFDPSTYAATRIGTNFGTSPGSSKWAGGVLAPNGKIYGMPQGDPSILVIDPATDTTTTIDITSIPPLSRSFGWSGGVLGANGKIYGIPLESDLILEIDPDTGTFATYNVVGLNQAGLKYAGGALAPNGKIYAVPFDTSVETRVLEINPLQPLGIRFVRSRGGHGRECQLGRRSGGPERKAFWSAPAEHGLSQGGHPTGPLPQRQYAAVSVL